MSALRPPRPEVFGLAVLLAVSGSCERKTQAPPAATGAPAAAQAKTVTRRVFYPTGSDLLLDACPANLPSTGTPQRDMAEALRRLLAGPPGNGQFQAFPENCGVRSVWLVGSQAVVDLTGPVREGGGSSTETARVYGVVQTLAANFPEVRTVRILVDGQEVDTLMGHLDLSRPLVPEPRLLSRSARETFQGNGR